VRDRADEFRRADAEILAVSFAAAPAIPAFRAELLIPFDVASDPVQSAYRAYGLGRASAWGTWHPRVLLRYVSLLLRGIRLARPARGADLSQLGGDFVIDAAGRIVFAFRSGLADERPTVDALLSAVGAAPG
jgi:peroxiredoxin